MDPLARRTLGSTDVEVTQLGFGGAGLGELDTKITQAQATATVACALRAGIRYFDTSPWYGRGLSELRLGNALRDLPRDEFLVSSKVGRVLSLPKNPKDFDRTPWTGGVSFAHRLDYSYDGIMRSFEDSIQRLGLPRIDLLLIHDLDHWHLETDAKVNAYMTQLYTSGFRALQELKEQKLISGIGAGINQAGTIDQFMDWIDLDFFLIALAYTLLDHTASAPEMARATERGMGFVVGGVFNSGILATGAVNGAMYNYAPALEADLARVRAIEVVCKRHSVPLAAAALQFPLGHPNVASVIPGAFSPEQVASNAAAMSHEIPADFWAELKHEGLVDAQVYVPTTNAA